MFSKQSKTVPVWSELHGVKSSEPLIMVGIQTKAAGIGGMDVKEYSPRFSGAVEMLGARDWRKHVSTRVWAPHRLGRRRRAKC